MSDIIGPIVLVVFVIVIALRNKKLSRKCACGMAFEPYAAFCAVCGKRRYAPVLIARPARGTIAAPPTSTKISAHHGDGGRLFEWGACAVFVVISGIGGAFLAWCIESGIANAVEAGIRASRR